MTDAEPPPFFTVIISSRSRPMLFERALQSVVEQTFPDFEIIVVVDGSEGEDLKNYLLLESSYPDAQFQYLVHRPNGHGQSYSMNFGVTHSRGTYLCFLDDDDYWIDDNYLQRTYESITHCDQSIDMHYSNQRAFFANETRQLDAVWLEDLIPKVSEEQKNINDSYLVDTAFIMQSNGFGHLNCSIFNKVFYESINGMDENIRYENDRDVFLRSIDAANYILFSTHYISHHNIPDAAKRMNMSTVASAIEKKLYQLRVYDKGICMSKKRSVIDHCRRGKTYELKHITQILVSNGDFISAAHYARAALLNGFNLRWLGYTLYLSFKGWTTRGSHG